MNCKKNENGVTLLILVITIIVIIILASAITIPASKHLKLEKLNEMFRDIEVLKSSIETYYIKNGAIPISENEVESEKISKFKAKAGTALNVNDGEKYYYINLNLLKNVSLSNTDAANVYIINEQSHEIYNINGVKYDDEWYFKDISISSEIEE